MCFVANFITFLAVKKFRRHVKFCPVKAVKTGMFFWDTVYTY